MLYVKCSVECCVTILGCGGVQGAFLGYIWSFRAIKVGVFDECV